MNIKTLKNAESHLTKIYQLDKEICDIEAMAFKLADMNTEITVEMNFTEPIE